MITKERMITYVPRSEKSQPDPPEAIAAAIELIAEKGVDGLRLREIADRADIGFGSFYNHFASKEELVEAVVTGYVGSLTQAIIVGAADFPDPAETTAVAHRMFVRLAYADPKLAWVIVQLDRSGALLETASHPHLGPVLARGMETGRFHGIEIDVAVSFIVGATIAVMRGILEGRLGANADSAARGPCCEPAVCRTPRRSSLPPALCRRRRPRVRPAPFP